MDGNRIVIRDGQIEHSESVGDAALVLEFWARRAAERAKLASRTTIAALVFKSLDTAMKFVAASQLT